MREMDEKYRELIESYLPGWQYAPDSGEPEAALLYAAWELLEDTRQRMECLPQKHEREFLNAWDLPPKGAEPMQTYAVLHAPEGERIPAGSEMYLSGNGNRLWKTLHSASAESMTLTRQILESPRLGKLIDISLPTEAVPSRLFDYRHRGMQRNAARFLHPDAFRSKAGGQIRLLMPECEESLLRLLTDAKCTHWTLECAEGKTIPLEMPKLSDRGLSFSLPGENTAFALTAEFEPGFPVPDQIIGRVRVQVLRPMQPCEKILTDEETVQTETFEPFGPNPELWRCCYLAAPDVLSLRGAEVQTEFLLALEKREDALPGSGQKPKYHSIMLRMPPPPPVPQEVRAQNVVWEYWNGKAWLPIPGTAQLGPLFASGEQTHRAVVRFLWPKDAASCEVQGQEHFWIRWRITRADGMGVLPRVVFTPRVSAMRMQGTLKDDPVEISVCSGLKPEWIPLEQNRTTRLFPCPVSDEDGWWLCFDHAPNMTNLHLYLKMAGRIAGSAFTVWESTHTGLLPCSFIDGTDGLGHSGTLFLDDLKCQLTEHFSTNGWWLCIRNRENRLRTGGVYANMTRLFCGAVILEAENTDACQAGETVRPLRGGAVGGETLNSSFGGSAEESDGDLLIRAEKARHHLNRAVSPLDVQQLLQSEFRDVVRTRCLQNGTNMEIAVLMRDAGQHSAAFSRRREQMTYLLEQKSVLPVTGLGIRVREPNFYLVHVSVWVHTDLQSDFQTDRERIQQVLEQFLNPVTGRFRGDGWHIGDLPTEQELSNDLMLRLPQLHLLKILVTTVTPQGRESQITEVRDPFALPMAGKIMVREVRRGGA